MRATHTYALLQVSPAAYAEIRDQLKAAEYEHAFHKDDGREVIDMHGLALLCAPTAPPQGSDAR